MKQETFNKANQINDNIHRIEYQIEEFKKETKYHKLKVGLYHDDKRRASDSYPHNDSFIDAQIRKEMDILEDTFYQKTTFIIMNNLKMKLKDLKTEFSNL